MWFLRKKKYDTYKIEIKLQAERLDKDPTKSDPKMSAILDFALACSRLNHALSTNEIN